MVKKTLEEIAGLVGGQLSGFGNPDIYGVTNIEEATEREITFAVPPHLGKAAKSKAGAVILPKDAGADFPKPAILVDNPRAAFARMLELFNPPLRVTREVHPAAVVSPEAQIGKNVAIMPGAVVDAGAVVGDGSVLYPHTYVGKDVKLGKDCLLYPSVTIYDGCQLGDRVVLHSGAAIGGDGFGYVTIEGRHRKVPQVGNVILGDDVEIGCNSCVDCGTTGSTIIGKGTKVDNLVHVAHNDIIGENCFLVAHVGISGSVKVGNNVTMAGQVATSGHLTIGDNCVFAGRSGITNDVPSNSVYAGFPAQPHKDWLKQQVLQKKLPDLMRRISELELKIERFENKK